MPIFSGGKKTCPYCYQQLSWHALSRHIRDMHRAKADLVTCKYCMKTFRNKNSLGCHIWRFHKRGKELIGAAALMASNSVGKDDNEWSFVAWRQSTKKACFSVMYLIFSGIKVPFTLLRSAGSRPTISSISYKPLLSVLSTYLLFLLTYKDTL